MGHDLNTIMLALGLVGAVFIIAWVFAPKGWRTVVFNVLAGIGIFIGPVLEHLVGVKWEPLVGPEYSVWVTQGVILANLLWRIKTTTPIGYDHVRDDS